MSGTISRFQSAINPHGLPGGTLITPVQKPSAVANIERMPNAGAFLLSNNALLELPVSRLHSAGDIGATTAITSFGIRSAE